MLILSNENNKEFEQSADTDEGFIYYTETEEVGSGNLRITVLWPVTGSSDIFLIFH